MEIEAKFRVPDDETFQRLEEAIGLGDFAVSPGRFIDLDDRYLDTEDYRVLSAGYFCRRRVSSEGIVMTFKGLAGGEGAIHRREEVSVELERDAPPSAWPEGPARELAVRLTGNRPLQALFALHQRRLERAVARGGRTVAELALDRVRVDTRRGGEAFLECEIELRPGGTEADLQELVTVVGKVWGLEPVTGSKFARGLALATGIPVERAQEWQRELRRLRVHQWVERTRGTRPVVPGAAPVGEVTGEPVPERPEARAPQVQALERTPTVTVAPDIERAGDMGAVVPVTGEPAAAGAPSAELATVEASAVAVTEGRPMAAEAHETPGEPAPDESSAEAEVEELEAEAEASAERPEAEVEVAAEVAEAVAEEPQAEAAAEEAAAEAGEAGAVAGDAATVEVTETLVAAGEGVEEPEEAGETVAVGVAEKRGRKEHARPGIVSDDTMDEAARKTFLFHFERMLRHEAGTREGEDPEELHDMRVATRRMRAALRVFDGYVDSAVMKPYLKALRRTGRTLGTVRDLDVFNEKTQRYLQSLPEGHQGDLDPLMAAWRVRRDEAREVMIDYLDSQAFARFTRRFGEFLEKPGAAALAPFSADGEPRPRHVRDALPVVLYERLAAVRAFDEWVGGHDVPLTRYHRLRIAAKGLRYTLEFFEEVLGPGAHPLIEHAKTLQDHLGDLQDAVVGCGVAGTFLTWGTWLVPGERPLGPAHPVFNAPGVATYLAHRQEEIGTLIETFPPVWEKVGGREFASGVAELVAGL